MLQLLKKYIRCVFRYVRWFISFSCNGNGRPKSTLSYDPNFQIDRADISVHSIINYKFPTQQDHPLLPLHSAMMKLISSVTLSLLLAQAITGNNLREGNVPNDAPLGLDVGHDALAFATLATSDLALSPTPSSKPAEVPTAKSETQKPFTAPTIKTESPFKAPTPTTKTEAPFKAPTPTTKTEAPFKAPTPTTKTEAPFKAPSVKDTKSPSTKPTTKTDKPVKVKDTKSPTAKPTKKTDKPVMAPSVMDTKSPFSTPTTNTQASKTPTIKSTEAPFKAPTTSNQTMRPTTGSTTTA